MKRFLMGTVTLISILSFNTASAVTIDLVNDFEDGTTMGWSKGFNSSPRRAPKVVQEANGNHYLQTSSIGGEGSDSQMTILGTRDWRGNYNTAGIGSVQARMTNQGNEDLYMRLGFSVFIGDDWHFYASKDALMLPADEQWYDLSFAMNEEHIVIFPGDGNYDAQWSVEDGMAAVRKIKFVSNKDKAAFWDGDKVVATLGLDDIRASAELLQAISLSQTNGFSAAVAVAPVPLPAAGWLLMSGLLGLIGVSKTTSKHC